jgi:hypothetical protein
MNELPAARARAQALPGADTPIFTLLGGTTIPERAAIVRAECHEGSHVELRKRDENDSRIDVWLACRPRLRLVKVWKRIGHVPDETAASLLPFVDKDASVIALGTVKAVYVPESRDEAVVTVEIKPQSRAWPSWPDTGA